jgi:AraC-like DNA-binding protein
VPRPSSQFNTTISSPKSEPEAPAFSEVMVWSTIGAGWRQLAGDFRHRGFSFELHEFTTPNDLDWGASFHPGSVELCLNLEGDGSIGEGRNAIQLTPKTAAFYCRAATALPGVRPGKIRHQFITVEYSVEFLAKHLASASESLHPLVRSAIGGQPTTSVSQPFRLNAALQQTILSLRHPPVLAAAQGLWFESKALELITACLFREADELFCTRQQRLARDRVEKVIAILKRDLANPPALEELGREVGCSHFYLSRTFSKEMGVTIPQHLRQLRLERAAELLRSGKFNVTEAALEVGYNSLSHFSQAFHEMFGCCPGLYPVALPGTKALQRRI